jgi:hypothetical protein
MNTWIRFGSHAFRLAYVLRLTLALALAVPAFFTLVRLLSRKP